MAKRLNIKMIKKVLRHIKADLRRLDMKTWAYRKETSLVKRRFAPCGTKACMAGWTVLLNSPVRDMKEIVFKESAWQEKARNILGFDVHEADKVFQGDATEKSGPSAQYKELRKQINDVLLDRGSRVRV